MAGHEVEVQLFAKAMELAKTSNVTLMVAQRTPAEILKELASMNPLVADSIVRPDGTPRSSTKVLINGEAPTDLATLIPTDAKVTIAAIIACDG